MKNTISVLFSFMIVAINAQEESFDEMYYSDTVEFYESLMIEQANPCDDSETIILLPKVLVMEDEGQYFELSPSLFVIDANTRKVKSLLMDYTTWQSDAIGLQSVQIVPEPYKIGEDKCAFGLEETYSASSSVHYNDPKYLSLFEAKDENLSIILENFTSEMHTGYSNPNNCNSEQWTKTSKLIFSYSAASDYYVADEDLKISFTRFYDKDGECEEETYSTDKMPGESMEFIEGRYR